MKPTYISDNFPIDLLECQYFDICNKFDADQCYFNAPCPYYLKVNKTDAIQVRRVLHLCLESSVEAENLKFQVMSIIHPKPKDSKDS